MRAVQRVSVFVSNKWALNLLNLCMCRREKPPQPPDPLGGDSRQLCRSCNSSKHPVTDGFWYSRRWLTCSHTIKDENPKSYRIDIILR